ncbi:MAG: DNA repair protein RecO [Candidatus Eisenbacteria bacterium]|uniref:DNA repair protein RecO n=1 Tax=Eiseniibacteriota bacterium TaxID=2212470 RepID=A0A948RU15_UNCEI|nr:DNA repair protein RecO [Candidatus Eisenbacteria bacterium]MBU1948040.1 DNA repair protein RecO [Candidatus Eisenbacteria bacterium]MBU2689699.1 DNA repair protein RecO [Candidatus Eisenbacteria bacterium]
MSVIAEDYGVVLRSHRFGETSRILVFLTSRHGKLHAIAKGARNPKNRFGAALDILAEGSFVFYLKKDRDLQLIRSAELETFHEPLLRDAVRYHYGCAAAEFADRLVLGQEEGPDCLDALRQFLFFLESAPLPRLSALFKAYQLRLAGLQGYRPNLEGCLYCSKADRAAPGLSFSIHDGALVCPRHRSPLQDAVPLSPDALQVLMDLVASDLPMTPLGWKPALDPLLTRVVEGFLRFHIDGYRGLKSLKSLQSLTRNGSLASTRGLLAGGEKAC